MVLGLKEITYLVCCMSVSINELVVNKSKASPLKHGLEPVFFM